MSMDVLYLVFLHFIADGLLQSREMAKKKSTDWRYLLVHVGIQIAVFQIALWPFYETDISTTLAWTNGIVHGFVDATIWQAYSLSVWKRRHKESRENGLLGPIEHLGSIHECDVEVKEEIKKQMAIQWKYWEDRWFYTTIMFDQFLHIATLIIVWNYLN